jgi:hypothetical protein
LALFSSLLKHKKKNFQCYLETIFLDSFAKLKNFIFLEKNSLQISSIVERTILKNLFPNIKFYVLIRKIKNDGSFCSQLTWASQILIILSHVPYKIKINFNSLGIIGNRILIDLTSEEMFFTKTYLEIISEEEQDAVRLIKKIDWTKLKENKIFYMDCSPDEPDRHRLSPPHRNQCRPKKSFWFTAGSPAGMDHAAPESLPHRSPGNQ